MFKEFVVFSKPILPELTLDSIISVILIGGPLLMGAIPLYREVIIPKNVNDSRFKSKSLVQRITPAGWTFVVIGLFVIGAAICGDIRTRKSEQDLKDVQRTLVREVRGLKYTIDTMSQDPADSVSDGFTLSAILVVNDSPDRRLKYIFDCGESMTLNRISLYLDRDNNLVFTVFDNSGVPYSVRSVPNFVNFKRGAQYFLHCDIGYSDDFSFIRIFLDDRMVGKQMFNNRISAENIKGGNCTIGGDLNGENNGSFLLQSLVVWKKVFSRKDIGGIMSKMIPPVN